MGAMDSETGGSKCIDESLIVGRSVPGAVDEDNGGQSIRHGCSEDGEEQGRKRGIDILDYEISALLCHRDIDGDPKEPVARQSVLYHIWDMHACIGTQADTAEWS